MTSATISPNSAAASSTEAARRAMIDSQLRPSGVNEPWVLAAMARTPREDFVPETARAAAYGDRAVPLNGGRFLAAPLAHGLMLIEAAPTPQDKALLIGDGQGYLAALLRPQVGALDAVAPENAAAISGGDYTLAIIDGAVEVLPATVGAALAEGGRIVTGVIERGVSRLAVGRKAAGEVALLALAETGIPALPEFAAPQRWSF